MLQKLINKTPLPSRWKIAAKTLPIVLVILSLKFFANQFNYEFLTLNSLFTAIISANIFLISFLISGVLVDYKESEKLPGDISSSIESMADEALIIFEQKRSSESRDYLAKLIDINSSLIQWFYKKEKTETLIGKLRSLNSSFLALEPQTQPNFVVRLKQEQANIRRIIKRIHTIRETNFLGSGYAIVEIITTILITGMIFIRMDVFYESAFFISFISFILIYMIFFIKDLDNPFGYAQEDNMVEEVSLKPIFDTQIRLKRYYTEMSQ